MPLSLVMTLQSGYSFKSSAWTNTGCPVARIGDIKSTGLRREAMVCVDSRTAAEAASFTLSPGDVLVAMTGEVGHVAFVQEQDLPMLVNQRVGLVRFSPNSPVVSSRFLYYLCLLPATKQQFVALAHGSVQPNLSAGAISNVLVPLPPPAEQQAIAEVLGTLDDKIEANGQLRAVCTSLLRATFERLARPGLMAVASGSDLPSGWLRGPLDKWLDVLETGSRPRGGVSKYKHGVPSLGAESVSGLAVFDYSKTKYVPEDYFASMRRGIVQNCDVLLYKDGGRPGQFEPHVAMLGEGFPFSTLCINEHVYRLRARAPMTQEYLFCWLSSAPMLEEMRRRGTGVAIPGLNSSAVKALPAGFPANGETAEFSALATDLVKQALSSAKEDRLLAELRDTLLPPLLCGELRVHDAEALVEGAV